MNNMIAERITELRKKKNMTQEDVARAFGVTNQAVSKWEAGINYPDVELIPRIASLFGVSVNYLFTGEEMTTDVPDDVIPELADDGKIRVYIFKGKNLLGKKSPTQDEWVNVNFEGDSVEVFGNVNTEDLTCRGGLSCHAGLTCRGDLIIEEGDINGPVNCDGDVVVKNGNINGPVDCDGNASITGDVEGKVSVARDAFIGGNVGENVSVGGDFSIGGNVGENGRVDCGGKAKITGHVEGKVSVAKDASIGGNVGENGRFDCGGNADITGDVRGKVNVANDAFIGGNAGENISAGGDLSFGGNAGN